MKYVSKSSMILSLACFTRLTFGGAIFPVDTNVIYTPDTNSQRNPAVAFDGVNHLVVWEDNRSGGWDIYGARIRFPGATLDATAIPISTAPNDQMNASVFFNGADYFVVWTDMRNDSLGEIYGTRINQYGVVLDPSGIPICSTAFARTQPSLAFDGINYLIVWSEYRAPDSCYIYGTRLDQNGTVLDSQGILISSVDSAVGNHAIYPSVSFNGSNYLIVFAETLATDSFHVNGRFMNPAGDTLQNSFSIPCSGNCLCGPAVAFDGTNHLVVWSESTDIYGCRVDQTGTVIGPGKIKINTFYDVGLQKNPAVVHEDDSCYYHLVWEDSSDVSIDWDIRGAYLNTSGTVIDSFTLIRLAGNQITPDVADPIDPWIMYPPFISVVYSGWTTSLYGLPVNRMRIWAKYDYLVGLQEVTHSLSSEPCIKIEPNPSYNSITVKYILPEPNSVRTRLFDAAGRVIQENTQIGNRGVNHITFDTTNYVGGVYFISVDTGTGIDVQKAILLK